eukprot:7461154-Lingulodinium_polyedra.AAC.1
MVPTACSSSTWPGCPPLKWRYTSDLCDLLVADGSGMHPRDLQATQELAAQVWSDWGQSKVVEDSNKQ